LRQMAPHSSLLSGLPDSDWGGWDMDYMFPGSDDDLDMEDTGMIQRGKQVARVKQMQK